NHIAWSLHAPGFGWHQNCVTLSLEADSHYSVHAGSKFEFGIWQFDFRQHRLGRLIQRVGEPSDFAAEVSTGHPVDRHLDLLACGDKGGFQFGDGDLDANSIEVRQSCNSRILRRTAGSRCWDERARIN